MAPMPGTITEIMDMIVRLPEEDRTYLYETMGRQVLEIRRHRLESRVLEARENYKAGSVMSGTPDELFAYLQD